MKKFIKFNIFILFSLSLVACNNSKEMIDPTEKITDILDPFQVHKSIVIFEGENENWKATYVEYFVTEKEYTIKDQYGKFYLTNKGEDYNGKFKYYIESNSGGSGLETDEFTLVKNEVYTSSYLSLMSYSSITGANITLTINDTEVIELEKIGK